MKYITIIALLTALTATAGPVYNINTHTERSRPPIKANVLPEQREGQAEGWRDIIPFTAPEGMVSVPGTRTLADTNTAPREVYEVWTEAEASEAAAVAEAAAKDGDADPSTWPRGIKEAILTVAAEVEANKTVMRQICTLLLNKGVVNQAQYDNAVAQIATMDRAAYTAAWRAMMDE